MSWAGVTIYGHSIPINGRRVSMKHVEDESFYWSFDEDVYVDLF